MIDRFLENIPVILKHEGGLADHKKDPGGVTNWGVSLRYLLSEKPSAFAGIDLDIDNDGDVDADDVRAMPQATAIEIYRRGWWERYGYSRLLPPMDLKVFDTSINAGPGRAHRLLQEALNSLGTALVVDGSLGPKTIAAANALNNKPLLEAYRAQQAQFYRDLVASNPAQFGGFLLGWLRRAAT